MTHWLDIVGVGEGGIADLPPATRRLVSDAHTLIGPTRLLETATSTPQEGGAVTIAPELIPWQPGLDTMLAQLGARRGTPTVVLASGDPMWFGIGATLATHLASGEFEVHPVPSSLQLAAARLQWPLQHIATISLHGRPVELLHPHLQPGNRILALTSDAAQLGPIRTLLGARGYGRSRLTTLEHLGSEREHVESAPADAFTAVVGDFYVLAIDCVAEPGTPLRPAIPGLPDEAFHNDGQLTKREVRSATLARLAPTPGALLWDVGAGCGSVAIEWMRSARDARAIAFEREGERLQMIAVNAADLGVPALRIVDGEVPESLSGMPAPDAVFIGGGLDAAVAEICWAALKPGGRLVANTVTVEGEQSLLALHDRLGGELSRIEVSSLETLGSHRIFRPRMPVTQFAVRKP